MTGQITSFPIDTKDKTDFTAVDPTANDCAVGYDENGNFKVYRFPSTNGVQFEEITITNGEADLTLGAPIAPVILFDSANRINLATDRGFTITANTHLTLDNAGTQNQPIPDGTYPVIYTIAPTAGSPVVLREPAEFSANGAINTNTVNIAVITAGDTYTLSGTRSSIQVSNERVSVGVTVGGVVVPGQSFVTLANTGSGWKDVSNF